MASLEANDSRKEPQAMPSNGPPLVTLLWLNFNSMKNISLIFKSLDSILGQHYPNFELLVIDNASNDGSWNAVKQHMASKLLIWPDSHVRFLRTQTNFGYTGGFDFGYQQRDPSSKYVAVISDDAILSTEYLNTLICELERDQKIGAIQGIVSTLDGKRIDSAGAFIDKLMIPHHIMRGEPLRDQEKPLLVSFVEGTCPVYRVEALQKILSGHLFYPLGFFQYLEDNLNGLLLWNNGYRCVTLPKLVAWHKREAGGGGILRTYCLWRNRTALVKLTDSRFKPFEYVFGLASMLYLLVSKQSNKAKMLVKGMYDGHDLAKKMRLEYGFRISLGRVPMYHLGIKYMQQLLAKSQGRGRLDEMDL